MNKSKELVEVYVARGAAEAEIIKGLLESCDIACLLRSSGSSIYSGQVPTSVMVRAEDADAARRLLEGGNHA